MIIIRDLDKLIEWEEKHNSPKYWSELVKGAFPLEGVSENELIYRIKSLEIGDMLDIEAEFQAVDLLNSKFGMNYYSLSGEEIDNAIAEYLLLEKKDE